MSAKLKSLTLSARTVAGGASVSGSVLLDSGAPKGGAEVKLVCEPPAVTLPASITIPEDGTKGGFSFDTLPVDLTVEVTITASYGDSKRATLEIVQPVTAKSLVVSPATIIGGEQTKATLTLSGPAHRDGIVVMVRSTNGNAIVAPPTVTVPAGQTTHAFAIPSKPTPYDTDEFVFAAYGVSAVYAPLSVKAPVPARIVLPKEAHTALPIAGKVILTNPAPPGFSLPATATPKPIMIGSPPGWVTFAGGASEAPFALYLPVAVPTDATVTVGSISTTIRLLPRLAENP
jgi:hypothetical protein